MSVINYVVYRSNPYHSLLYAAMPESHAALPGGVDEAIDALATQPGQILHINWEEHALRYCATAAEAAIACEHMLGQLRRFTAAGGRCFWTVHNIEAHEQQFTELQMRLRQGIADVAERIVIHTLQTVEVLQRQIRLPQEKLFYLPHPSYLGHYEPEEQTRTAALAPRASRQLLVFGQMRRYKGLHGLLEALPEGFLEEQALTLRLVGQARPGDEYLDSLRQATEQRRRVRLEPRRVSNARVAPLFHASLALVLPHERFLNSGVALLGLSLGLPSIAPATEAMRELWPVVAHRLLYRPGEAADLRRAVGEVAGLGLAEREEIVRALLARAQHLHPARISRELLALFETAPPARAG
ncbi:glycosyltransferase [Pseudoroseomonas cervicalis]|uniref:glycosyltransferase n=1 Tax=Teichococcus cervicalis TaxID=204525 RepID=UPI0022F16E67|nr:glycosyltransferase [Pseudoroseomonas cervicalis]WBV44540.1 hypothetical protein PFY06_08290 [Pseudoroseomonas cervicalis]